MRLSGRIFGVTEVYKIHVNQRFVKIDKVNPLKNR